MSNKLLEKFPLLLAVKAWNAAHPDGEPYAMNEVDVQEASTAELISFTARITAHETVRRVLGFDLGIDLESDTEKETIQRNMGLILLELHRRLDEK